VLFEEVDGLRFAVFVDAEVFFAESGDGFAFSVVYDDIDNDFACAGFKDGGQRGRLRRLRVDLC